MSTVFVCLFAEAEHGYASMPPFISSRERENLKRKSKSKKNTSNRYACCTPPPSGVHPFVSPFALFHILGDTSLKVNFGHACFIVR